MNALRVVALTGAYLTAFCNPLWAGQNDCNSKPQADEISNRIVAAVMKEYAIFNGHRIDASGRLWKFGSTETENESLLDPESGAPVAHDGALVTWRRVWEYWLVLDQHVPGIALSRKVIATPGLLSTDGANAAATEKTLGELFSASGDGPSDARESLRQAAVRAALSDSPWSAAFISFVMHQAGLDDRQFRYAAAHWQYVQQAFGTDSRRAYRACDPRRTRPKPGDLLCYSRGPLAPDDFEGWLRSVSQPRFSAASHCEVVVIVDRGASKLETVGGNVLQSVAMRRLKLNQDGFLSAVHYAGASMGTLPLACSRDKTCRQAELNSQRWSVLLQRR